MGLHGFYETDEATALESDEDGMGRSEDGVVSYLALALPVLDVIDVTTPAEVDLLARADEHVWGGHDVGYRVFLWIVSGEPDRDRDVVCGLAVGDGESAMDTEQQLGSAVVVRWGRW